MEQTPDRSTHFVFEHRVFNVKGAHFALTADGVEPAFHVNLGDLRAALRLDALRNEFGISLDSPDGELLGIVEKSLRFVKEIRPGDSIPRELLDGSASWSVEERHRALASGRLAVQIASWLTGKETVIADHAQLTMLMDDPQTKSRMQKAFAEIAEKLGIGTARKQEVIDRIDELARELSYIEALRERYTSKVRMIVGKVNLLAKLYRADRAIIQELTRIQSLLVRPVEEFDSMFDQIDAATCEIMSVLRKFDALVKFVRDTRDEVHTRLMLWEPVIRAWETLDPVRGPLVEAALKELYRFAARHFPQQQEWKLGSY